MASLFERLSHDPTNQIPDTIAAHDFTDSLRLLASGSITRAQLVSAYSLTSADENDLDFIKGLYDDARAVGYGGEFLSLIESAIRGIERGLHGLEIKANFVAALNDANIYT